MIRASTAALLVAILSVPGCFNNGGSGDGGAPGSTFHPQWSELALASGDGHDHSNASQHAGLTTPNFQVLGHNPLVSDYYGKAAGGYVCGDAQQMGDGRRIAAVESRSNVGFALADVTDPAAPTWLGELILENTYIYDLAVVPDGKHVVLVTRHSTVEGVGNIPPLASPSPRMTWNTPCADPVEVAFAPLGSFASPEDVVPRPMSILLVDISNPAQPVIIDQQPLYGFGHSVYSTIIDAQSLLLVTTLGPNPAAAGMSGFELYDIIDTPLGSRLELLSIYRPPESASQVPANPIVGRSGHDGWIAKHPVSGLAIAYLVGSDLFTMLDISDPRDPVVIGIWSEAGVGREGFSGSLHSVLPLGEVWDGRHYTIVGPEFGGHPTDHPSGIVWVLDTTDPMDIHEVAAWTLPHEVEWSGTYMFSNHYYGVVDKTLFVSMYHGGIWAVDLASVGTAPFVLLHSIGAFLPSDESADPAVVIRWRPNSQEVLTFEDGTMLTFDSSTGLWTFKFDASDPAPAPEPWPIVPVHA